MKVEQHPEYIACEDGIREQIMVLGLKSTIERALTEIKFLRHHRTTDTTAVALLCCWQDFYDRHSLSMANRRF